MTINGLEERILALSGVEKRKTPETQDIYFLGETPFITEVTNQSLVLHMTKPCIEKLNNALRGEPRVESVNEDLCSARFRFRDDVDKEFVFLYIRYAWKFWRTTGVAA